MIQIPEGIDRGKFLIERFPDAVKDMVIRRKQEYFGSRQYKALKNNCQIMDMYIDNKEGNMNSGMSNVAPKIIRKAYHDYQALFHKFFENNPFFSVRRSSDMTPEDVSAITQILAENTEKTEYRDQCFSWTIDHITRYGTSATYSFAVDDLNSNSYTTVKSEGAYGDSTYQQQYRNGEIAAISIPIHPLNVIIDPHCNFMTLPDYKGLLLDIYMSNLAELAHNPNYINSAVNKAFRQIKDGMPDEYWYNGSYTDKMDFSKGHGSICYLWTRLPFEGNEADPTIYAIEEIAGEIIRIEENTLDDGTIPLAITRTLPRQFDWFGNTPLLEKISLQNLQHWTFNTMIESTAKAMDRLIFYRAGSIDEYAINSRHQTGGLVPYRGEELDLSRLMYAPKLDNIPFRDMDYLVQLARREDQETSVMPNFNPQSEGGPTNKTLGGAKMMASIGELRFSKHVLDVAKGQKVVGSNQISLLKNVMSDSDPRKQFITKQHCIEVKTANVFNYVSDTIEAGNRLTEAINYTKTGIPEFAGFKFKTFIEDWLRATTKHDDIDEYYEEPVQPAGQAGSQGIPSPAPGAPNMGGML